MIPASFRSTFLDTVRELAELLADDLTDEVVSWNAEYLSRKTIWYHFEGRFEDERHLSSAHVFDTATGAMSTLDAAILPLALLDFADNGLIAAYYGNPRSAAQIASEMLRGLDHVPEIVSVFIERHSFLECGSRTTTATSFVFVGFESIEDVDDIGSGKGLAARQDAISQHWYRSRVRLVPSSDGAALDQWRAAGFI